MGNTEKSVIVIGAGLAGLAAAHRLREAGVPVTVLEASGRAGGRVVSRHYKDYLLDTGADVVTGAYRQYLTLLETVGMSDQLVPLPAVVGTIKNGKPTYIDTKSLWSLISCKLLSLSAKIKMARGMLKHRPRIAGVRLAHMYELGDSEQGVRSTRQQCYRTFGQEASDYVLDPMVRSLGGTGLDNSAWADVLGSLGLVTASTWALKGGMDSFSTALARDIDVQFNSRVITLDTAPNGITVTVQKAGGDIEVLQAGGCVIATMFHEACAFYPSLFTLCEPFSRQLTHIQLIKIQLCYTAPTATAAYVIQVPSCEDADVMLVFLDHNKAPDRAPPGHSIVSVFIETGAYQRYADLSEAELLEWGAQKAEKWFPELAGARDGGVVTWWPNMGPAVTPGYYQRAAQLLSRQDTMSRVHIACDVFTKTSQEAAVVWGRNAARRLVESLGARG